MAIERALDEVEGAIRRVQRIKGRQVRSAEQKAILKATALSWFNTHRPRVVELQPAETVQSTDRAMNAVLTATSQDCTPSTYLTHLRAAKRGLIEARSNAVVLLPKADAVANDDVEPDFTSLAADEAMKAILVRRWRECRQCLSANAPLAATVMMGGLLEALFVAKANRLADKRPLFQAKATPRDGKTGKPLDLRAWTLGPYIDVGHELNWISRSAKDVAIILRDYRNYVHPEKERAHGIVLSLEDARVLWGVTKSLARELLAVRTP